MINIKKQYQQTAGLIQGSINISHLFVDWCYCGREVFFEKVCLFLFTSLTCMKNNFLSNRQREYSTTQPFFAGHLCGGFFLEAAHHSIITGYSHLLKVVSNLSMTSKYFAIHNCYNSNNGQRDNGMYFMNRSCHVFLWV